VVVQHTPLEKHRAAINFAQIKMNVNKIKSRISWPLFWLRAQKLYTSIGGFLFADLELYAALKNLFCEMLQILDNVSVSNIVTFF